MGFDEIWAGVDAERTERAPECHQHRQILFQGVGEVKTNPITGQTVVQFPPRYREYITPKYHVPGLKVWQSSGNGLRFEFFSKECISEADARDAQCRAGWDDNGYGFEGLEIGIMLDGQHRAKWSCSVSCE